MGKRPTRTQRWRPSGSGTGRSPSARARLLLAIPIALLPLAVPLDEPAAAQVIDRGTFTLFMEGARIGEERFLIRHERAGAGIRVVQASGELNVKVDGETRRIRVAIESASLETVPRRYEAKIDGEGTTQILGVLRRDRLKINIRSPRGEEIRQFLIEGPGTLLDLHVAHHYYFVARLLGEREERELTVLIPRTLEQRHATLRAAGEETLQIGRNQVRVRRLTLSVEGRGDHHVWVDGDRVMRVEVPGDEWVAVRASTGTQVADRQGG